MGVTAAAGMDQATWAKLEASYDTLQRFVATDAVGLNELKLEPSQAYLRSKEHLGTASLVDEIKGKAAGKWSAQSYVKPNGAGVAPDVGDMVKAAMGAVTVVASTSVTYSFNSLAPPTLQLARAIGTQLYECVTGAWVEELTIEVVGNQPALFNWSGGFATYGWVFGAGVYTPSTVSEAATSFTLAESSRGKIGVGACIKIGTDDNSGTGYLVTGYDPDNATVTFAPALAATQTGATLVVPFTPSQTIGGNILSGVNCGLSFDGGSTALGMNSCKVNIKTGFHGLDKEATASKVTGVSRGRREVMFEANAYYDATTGTHTQRWLGMGMDGFVAGFNGADANILARIGSNTVAKRLKLVAAKARVEVVPVNVPDEEEATVDIKAVARMASAANDELTLVFD